METESILQLLEQARNYRRLGNAVQDRMTRLALLELAFEFEQRAEVLLAGVAGARRAAKKRTPAREARLKRLKASVSK